MNAHQGSAFDLVILAAGNASRLWPLTLDTSKVMLCISGKPGLFHILDKMPHADVNKVIIVCSPDGVGRIRQTLDHCFGGNRFKFELVVQRESKGPADALQAAESSFSALPVLLWLGDTLADFPPIDGVRNFITTSKVENPARWCMVEHDADNSVIALQDKPRHSSLTAAVIGQYYFTSGEELCNALAHGRSLWRAAGAEFELSMVLDYYIKKQQLFMHSTDSWTDYGTMQSYAQCKQWIPERFFNHISVSEHGLLTKTSVNANIVEEMLWFSSIAEDCRILAPRKVSENLLENSYAIEYIDYKTLSEYFIFHPIHSTTWEYIATSLLDMMIKYFWGRPVRIPDIEKRTKLVYYDKTLERVDKYVNKIDVQLDRPLIVNDREYGTVRELLAKLETLIPTLYAGAANYCSVIHGDLVFSNILCSFPKPIFRLIDPRGTFGKIGPFGDYRYELAKLRQCYEGMYDAIMHNLFDLEKVATNRFAFRIYPDRADVRAIFDKAIVDRLSMPLHEIELIQILLFFSLVPLHHEPTKAMAYFLRACTSLGDYIQKHLDRSAPGGVARSMQHLAAPGERQLQDIT